MFTYLLITLAVYRISYMVASEDGPFDVFAHWRGWLHEHMGDGHWSWVYEGFRCVLCVSFWLSWIGALAVTAVPYPLAALGVAGGVLVLFKWNHA